MIWAQPDTILLVPDVLLGQERIIELTGLATVWQSRIGDESIPANAPLFTNGQQVQFEPGNCWNLHFFIKNASQKDTALCYLVYQHGARAQVKISTPDDTITLKTGCHRNLDERALRYCNRALPIQLPPGEGATAMFSLDNNMTRKMEKLTAGLFSEKSFELDIARRELMEKPFFNFNLFLLSSLLLMGLFALSQYFSTSDKSYFFYALYAWSVLLYYSRSFSTYQGAFDFPNRFASHFHTAEPILNTLNMLAYVLFISHFLKADFKGTHAEKWLTHIKYFFQVLLLVDIIFLMLLSPLVYFETFNKIRFGLMGIFLLFTVQLIFMKTTQLSKFILFGTTLLLVPIFIMTVANFFPASKTMIWGGCLEKYAVLAFPNYTTRTGILLEMTVFLFGLTYKTRQERLESERIRQENLGLENQRQSLAAILAGEKTLRQEERNQWSALLLNAEREKQTLLDNLNQAPNGNQAHEPNPFLQKLETVLESNFSNTGFSTNELAAAMGTSRASLYRHLTDHGADAPSDLLRDFRLQKAAILLRSRPDLNVAQVAYSCGFDDSGYFIKLFSKKYGKTPLQWRKNGSA